MIRTTLALVASLITCTFGVEFDYDKYDQESFNTSSWFRNTKSAYYHSGDNTGKAMLTFKNEAITWEWKDSRCSAVSQYFMDGVGEYQFSGTYKCSFKPKDVMNVAELFFMGDGAEGFKKKYGQNISKSVAESPVEDVKPAISVAEVLRMASSDGRGLLVYEEKYVLSGERTRVELKDGINKPVKFLNYWVIIVGEASLSDSAINAHKRFGKPWRKIQLHLTWETKEEANAFYKRAHDQEDLNVTGKLTNQLPGPADANIVQLEDITLEKKNK